MTSTAEHSSPQVCPACIPGAADFAATPTRAPATDASLRRIEFSLPSIHCANCISGVERVLERTDGVAAARVNLTLKRVAITAEDTPGIADRLIRTLTENGFEARPLDSAALEATRTDAEGRALLARIGVAGFALMNVMLLSISVWSGATDSTRDLMHWISAAIALPAVAFAAQPFFANAIRALRGRRLDMDVPIATAIGLTVAVSLWETARSGAHAFFDAALMLTFFLLIGRYLAHLTRASARSAAAEIAALEVQTATRIAPDSTRTEIPADAVRPGDLLAVAPGARMPADGTIASGRSEIDTSMLTGETMPASLAPGDAVRAGMTNLTGALELRVDAVGDDTLLAEVGRLIETAERSRGRAATLADRASRWYSHIVNALAATAFLWWIAATGDARLAINVAVTVLIITCPCALGLAVPAVLTAASGRLFRAGVLLKDGTALERLAEIDTIVFDKTGTLTTGTPSLQNAAAIAPGDLALAGALAAGSVHPLSRAILAATDAAGIAPAPLSEITEHPGLGTEARVDGELVRLGRAEWVGGAPTSAARTTAWLRRGALPPIAFEFEHALRPDMRAVLDTLRARGHALVLLSGDAERPVADMARALGIADFAAGLTPAEKVARLQSLAASGHKTLMVGDGLNDAAALAAAHVSISPGSAVDASRSAADMIVLGDSLRPVVEACDTARRARARIRENFAFAFAYNAVTVPIAYAGLVTPLIAAIAMSGSSIAVSLNALRMKLEPRP